MSGHDITALDKKLISFGLAPTNTRKTQVMRSLVSIKLHLERLLGVMIDETAHIPTERIIDTQDMNLF